MLTASEVTITVLSCVVQDMYIGTNLNLLRLMWALVNGSFLKSRGAVHGALAESGFADEEIRRSWSGLRYGVWQIEELLWAWHLEVVRQGEWQATKLEGYRVKSIDITGFWRPKLQGKVNKLYNAIARRALPAIIFGVIIHAGEIRGHRVPLLQSIVRCPVGTSESAFHTKLLQGVQKSLLPDEVVVVDAGFTVTELLEGKIGRFVVRSAVNCTARKNVLPEYKGRGARPKYGDLLRPLPRTHKGKVIDASAAEESGEFTYQERTIRHEAWHNLVTSTTKVDAANDTFSIYLFHDPAYLKPLVLTTVMRVKPETVYRFYKERWPVEHPPLATKQMMGLHRQFVFADESCFRLPELGLLTGNILTHLAATLPPMPTGFWDREPKATPGRLRRVLSRAIFPNLDQLPPELRKKDSVTDHLPKGADAHRRSTAIL